MFLKPKAFSKSKSFGKERRLMKEKVGEVFSIARDNPPVRGCTVSKQIHPGENAVIYFSMAERTDISAELYPYHKLLFVAEGEIEVYGTGEGKFLSKGQAILTPVDKPVGIRSEKGAVYTEISIRREDFMNEAVKAGEVFRLADLLPYQEGKIVNMDLMHNEKMKFVLMSFSEGTGLSEHAAPGEAMVFALEGEAVIQYEGVDHVIHAGEEFHFAKAGRHAVTAKGNFKMALLISLA